MTYDFNERLLFSEGIELHERLMVHLLESVPASVNIKKATEREDRNGTDYWIERDFGLPPISVDMKNRSMCPIKEYGSDDACIETTSVYRGPGGPPWEDSGRKRVGWSLDIKKRTDLIVYTWPTKEEGRRFWILYFPHLCAASINNWQLWVKEYGERKTLNNGYYTLNVYVPRTVIAKAMRELVYGEVAVEDWDEVPF